MKTEKIVVTYTITTEQYRAEVAAATGPVARTRRVEIPVGDLTPEARLALVGMQCDGSLAAGGRCMADDPAPTLDLGACAEVPTAADVSAELVARLDRAEMARAHGLAHYEDAVWRAERAPAEVDFTGAILHAREYIDYLSPRAVAVIERHRRAKAMANLTHYETCGGWPRYSHDDLGGELTTRWGVVEARRDAVERAAEQAKAAEAQAKVAERAAWIGEHGSERLKLALQLGQSLTGYDSERLTAEHPGWGWDNDGVDGEPRHQPDLSALQALATARAEFPQAELATLWPDCDGDDPSCEDHECGHRQHYVIRARYRGGKIRQVLHQI